MFASRLVAYAPNGPKLGPLADPAKYSAHLPINGVSALVVDYFKSSEGVKSFDQPVEVALEVSNGGDWVEPANSRFVRMVRGRDQAEKAGLWSFQMPGYGVLLKNACVLPATVPSEANTDPDGKRKFLSATSGTILKTVLDEARAFDPQILPGLTFDFTTTKDSAGQSWAKVVTLAIAPGLALDSLIESLADQGMVDWEIQGRTLRAFNADTALGRDRKGVRIHDQDADSAPAKGTLEGLKHHVILLGDEGKTFRRENPSAPTPWGKSVSMITQGGVSDEGTAATLIQAELDAGARERIEYTRSLVLTGNSPAPLFAYRPGDYITARNLAGDWESQRVFALGIGLDAGRHTVSLTLNDLFTDALTRQAKRLKGVVGGAVSEGGSGARPTPPEAGKRVPVAPAGLVVSSSHYFDSQGRPHAAVSAAYDPATTGTDGLALTMTSHELYGRALGGAYQRLTSVPGSPGTMSHSPLPVDETWYFQVRAISENGIPSDFSNVVEVHLAEDTEPPGRPSKPTITTRTGIISVQWDYLLATGGSMPIDFDFVDVEVTNHGGAGFVSAGKITMNGGALPITSLPFGVVTQIRFIAVDTSGNRSVPSEITSVTAQRLVDTDLSDTSIFESLEQVDQAAGAAAEAAAAAQSTATAAGTAADSASAAAMAADEAARAAAGLAGSKGEVIYAATAPTGDKAKTTNLWVRTSNNQPHTYNGSTWVAVTDKAATDAATAAGAAQSTANNAVVAAAQADAKALAAQSAAAAAQSKADAAAAAATTAQATADGKNRLIRSAASPSGTGFKAGDQWWKYEGARLKGYWIHDGSTWVSQVLDGAILAHIDAGTITVGFLSGERLEARSIGVEKLAIGDFENYAADIQSQIGRDGFPAASSQFEYVDDPVISPFGAAAPWTMKMVPGSSFATITAGPDFRVTPGEIIYASFMARNDASNVVGTLNLYAMDALGTLVTYDFRPAGASPNTSPNGVWVKHEGKLTVPAGVYLLRPQWKRGSNGQTVGVRYFTAPVIRRAVVGELVVDGTIKAQHVKTNELTVQHFVAGALQAEVISVMSSDHEPGVPAVRIDGQGVRTFNREGGDAVKITGLGDDFFTITNTAGDTVATLDSVGGGAFQDITVTNQARFDGSVITGADPLPGHGSGLLGVTQNGRDTLGRSFIEYVEDHPDVPGSSAWLSVVPHGIALNHVREDPGISWDGINNAAHFQIRVGGTITTEAGRLYQITYATPAMRSTLTTAAVTMGESRVIASAPGGSITAGGPASAEVPGGGLYYPNLAGWTSGNKTFLARCPEDIPAGRIVLGVELWANAGCKIVATGNAGSAKWILNVLDMGVRRAAFNGQSFNLQKQGSNPPPPPPDPTPPPKKEYTTTWDASWGQGYRGNNTYAASSFDGKATQGYSPYATSMGVHRGLVGFPSLVSTLSGADMVRVEVYVYASHWHANAGGTLCIGGHTHAGKPTTWSSNLNDAIRQKLKKPEGRWITLPSSMYAGFKSGLYKGISLLPPGSSTSTEYYGYIDWAKTKIRATYKK